MSNQTQKENLSALLIQHCKEKNLSGNQLAARLSVSQPSAQAYLDARTYPSEDVRKRIARELGITFRELQKKLDGIPVSQSMEVDDLTEGIRSLPDPEFYAEIVPVVFERILADRRQSRAK